MGDGGRLQKAGTTVVHPGTRHYTTGSGSVERGVT